MKAHALPRRLLLLAFLVPALCWPPAAAQSAENSETSRGDAWFAAPMDWPHWRGPEMNGVSREKNLPDSWKPGGDTQLWKNEKLAARSTPIIMNGKLYTLVRDEPMSTREGEKVVCADAATGEILWENRFEVFLSDVPDTRVGWSSVVGDPSTGNVYALGVCGLFQCLDGETGKTLWSHSLSEEYGLLSTYGGRTNFPVIHGNLVIISAVIIGWGDMAKPAHRFIAFDKRNGVPVWFEGTKLLPEDTTYSSPVTTVINGQAMMIFGSGDGGVYAFQPRTGKQIWGYDASARGINTTPVVAGTTVICGHSEENLDDTTMGALFALDAAKQGDLAENGGVLWRHKEWTIGKTAPIVLDDRVYAVDDSGTFYVADLKTGETIDRQKIGTMGRGSPVYGDGKIYLCEANGRGYIFQPTEKGLKILERVRFNREEIMGSAAISHGRVYLPTSGGMYCFGNKDATPKADPRPALPDEQPISSDTEPAQVQVVPVEALLKPGQRQQYQVRLFNARGQYLGLADELGKSVAFKIEGPGSIDEGGKYSTPADAKHAAVYITATVGDLKGDARVRIVPDLPWSFNFDDGTIPVTWVGIRYRHVPIDDDLLKSLEAKNPLAGKLYIFLTSSFVNSGQPAATYKDAGSRLGWTDLLRYLGLLGDVTDLSQAREKLDPLLQILQDENVIAQWNWKGEGDTGISLAVQKGSRKLDGNVVMCKLTTIPKGTRSQGWLGRTDFSNYTVQADVYSPARPNATGNPLSTMPDIGLIAQRYRMEMLGTAQELRASSWYSHDRKLKHLPHEWKSDVWYTIKMQSSVEDRDGKQVAVVRGKAWPRDSKEPQGWQIEWIDEPANTKGSPGLAGNAKDAEIFIDNIKVYQNESLAAGLGK